MAPLAITYQSTRGPGPLTIADLTGAMDLDQTTVSRNLDVLRRAKLLFVDHAYPLRASRQATLVGNIGGEAGWSALRGDLARITGAIEMYVQVCTRLSAKSRY